MPKKYLLKELGLKDDVMVYLHKTAQVPPVLLKFNKNKIKLVMLPYVVVFSSSSVFIDHF